MACKCAPALLTLRNEVNARWPNRDKSSDGCCGDAAHAARKSDHNPDAAGYAHAYDVDENLAPSADPAPLMFLAPILLADPRAKYVIYERHIYYPAGAPKPYTGLNAHEHHLHLSIKPGATFDTAPWLTALDQEDDMTPAQEAKLDDLLERVTAMHQGNWVDSKNRGDLRWFAKMIQPVRDELAAIKAKLGI